MPRRSLAVLVLTVCAVAVAVGACSSDEAASTTVTITHPPVTPVGTIQGAADGVGTTRFFHGDVTFEGIGPGYFDATMMTTSVDTAAGQEVRITKIVFVLDETNDQLTLEGSSIYPSAGSTIVIAGTVSRPIIGGSGAWAGARGSAVTTHLEDNSWRHVFELMP